MSTIQIDNVGISFVCTRQRKTEPSVVRKFVTPECKSKHTFEMRQGKIASIYTERLNCKAPCAHCTAQIEKAKNLINGGK